MICLILNCKQVYSWTEIAGEFGYEKQVYGHNRQNKLVNRTYTANIAQYFFSMTAIEINYSSNEEITTENNTLEITGTGYSVVSMQNTVTTDVYGIGIRQSFSGRKSRIRPMLSIGYAKQFVQSRTDMTFQDDSNGDKIIVKDPISKKRVDSVFGTFMLQLYITRGFSVRGSVKTIFPAFEFDKAKDDLRYLAGFSWMF